MRHEMRYKGYCSFASFIVWFGFVIAWLLFFAIDYSIFATIAVSLASLILIGGFNGVIWVPREAGPDGGGWRVRLSIGVSVIWLAFVILWLPFFAGPFTVYRNSAILLASFFIMVVLNVAAWASIASREMPEGIGRRATATFAVGLIWCAFLIIWLWFFADLYTPWEFNVAILILSILPVYVVLVGMWLPWARRTGQGHEGWAVIALLFAWLVVLFVWFWLFAPPFNVYQNFAFALVTLVAVAAIGAAIERR